MYFRNVHTKYMVTTPNIDINGKIPGVIDK